MTDYVWVRFPDGTYAVVAPDGQIVSEGVSQESAEAIVAILNSAAATFASEEAKTQ
jgi:hypothetical protein